MVIEFVDGVTQSKNNFRLPHFSACSRILTEKGGEIMDFSKASDCICPLLSIGQEVAIECQKMCILRNPETDNCSLTALEFLIRKDLKEDL